MRYAVVAAIVAGFLVGAQDTFAQAQATNPALAINPAPTSEQAPATEALIGQWIGNLGDDSYNARRIAKRQLLTHARLGAPEAEQVIAALRLVDDRSPDSDLELFLASQTLLREIQRQRFDFIINRFLHDDAFDAGELEGWDAFARLAGESPESKRVFAEALQRWPEFGRQLSADENIVQYFEPEAIGGEDAVAWSMLLAGSCLPGLGERHSLRINALLRCYGNGPMPERRRDQVVTGRLVESYLEGSPADVRDKIAIGTRYQCVAATLRRCRDVLEDPTETPSRIVTAMLAASLLGAEEASRWIAARQHDDRTSHVWRSMMPPKTTRRTQVRDVALALQLHRAQIDPREAGFTALAADPILVFRAYSLGFESDEAREACHETGHAMLAR